MSEAFVAACVDGVLVRCPYGKGQPTTIQFDADPPITIQNASQGLQATRGLYLVAARQADGDHWAIVQAQSGPPYAVLIKRRSKSVTKLGIANGQDPVWVTPSGLVAYVEESGRSWWGNGVSTPCPQTSQGFAYFTAIDQPVFRDKLPSVVLGGVNFIRPRQSGTWWVGQGQKPDSVLAYDSRSGQVWTVWVGKTPVGPNITEQAAGSAIAGVNPFDLLIPSASFVPYVALPQPVPEPIPLPSSCRLHACSMDGWKSANGGSVHFLPGTIVWGGLAYDQRLVNESLPWALPYGERLFNIWVGTEEQPDVYPTHDAYVKASIAAAKQFKRKILVVSDAPEFTTKAKAIEAKANAAGVSTVRGLEAYPFPGETTDESADRINRLILDAKTAKKKVGIVSRVDWPGCLALAPRIHHLINVKYPDTVKVHDVFGTFRSESVEAIETTQLWVSTWALMPSGVVPPL